MSTQRGSSKNSTSGIIITAPWRVSKVTVHPQFRLEVTFIDGTHGYVDMSAQISGNRAGVFAALRDEDLFKKAYIEYGAVTWPGEIDLAPDAMYEAIKTQGEWKL